MSPKLPLRLPAPRHPRVDSPPPTGYPLPIRTFTAVIERDPPTFLYVGHAPGFPGAHSQGATLDELRRNLQEVLTLVLEDARPSS